MTSTRDEYQGLFDVYWPIGVAVFVVVAALVAFLLIRFRSPGEGLPRGRETNTALEGVYALFLAAIVSLLVFLTFDAQSDIDSQFKRRAALEIEVTAAQWNWRFEYPDGAVEQGTRTRIPVLRVPVGQPVNFRSRSIDVQHAFWVPIERFKRDVFPERTTTWQLTFDELGFHPAAGLCAEFCGLRHSNMRFNVEVMDPEAFERWLARASERRARQPSLSELSTRGPG